MLNRLSMLAISGRRALTLLAGLLGAALCQAQPGLEDPTRPSDWQAAIVEQAAKAVEPAFKLDSILLSPQRRVAVINGRSWSEGESRDGLTLMKVEERRVLVRDRGQVKELLLKPVSSVRR